MDGQPAEVTRLARTRAGTAFRLVVLFQQHIMESARALRADVLLEGDGHAGDVVAVPQRLQPQVGEAQHREVLNHLLALRRVQAHQKQHASEQPQQQLQQHHLQTRTHAHAHSRATACHRQQTTSHMSQQRRLQPHQVVVNSEELRLFEQGAQVRAELLAGLQVAPEGLLHDAARPPTDARVHSLKHYAARDGNVCVSVSLARNAKPYRVCRQGQREPDGWRWSGGAREGRRAKPRTPCAHERPC